MLPVEPSTTSGHIRASGSISWNLPVTRNHHPDLAEIPLVFMFILPKVASFIPTSARSGQANFEKCRESVEGLEDLVEEMLPSGNVT